VKVGLFSNTSWSHVQNSALAGLKQPDWRDGKEKAAILAAL
jgi:hypothetical protein